MLPSLQHLPQRQPLANLNRFGVVLCLLYLLMTAYCLWCAYLASGDPKGQFVMLQLPIVLQLALLDALGMQGVHLGWIASYLLLIPIMLLVLYLIGAAISGLWRYSKLGMVMLAMLFFFTAWFWDNILTIVYASLITSA